MTDRDRSGSLPHRRYLGQIGQVRLGKSLLPNELCRRGLARRWPKLGVLLLCGLGANELRAQAGGLLKPRAVFPDSASLVNAVVVEQLTTGLPDEDGKASKAPSRQILWVDPSGERLFMQDERQDPQDPQRRWYLDRQLLVRMDLDPPVIYTIAPDRSRYIKHAGDMNDIQKDRRIVEENEIRRVSGLPLKQKDKYYEENPHLRPDGKRIPTVERGKGKKLLDRECEHLVIKENGLTIIDAQLTTDFPGAKSYFHLYRRLGVFSEEVLEELEEIEGVPLEAKITVVSAITRSTLESRIRRFEQQQISSALFELPPKAVEYVPDGATGICPECGVKIEDPSIAFKFVNEENQTFWLCSDRCGAAIAAKTIGKNPRRKFPRPRKNPRRSKDPAPQNPAPKGAGAGEKER